MSNKIKPKRSYTTNAVPTAADLEVNELAINWADGIVYTKDASGQIVSFTLGGGGGGGGGFSWSAAPVNADDPGAAGSLAYDADYLYVATTADTWKRTPLSTWAGAGTDEYFSSVSLLMHMDGTGSTFVDSSGTPKTITAGGDATQSTAESKWGAKSAYLDGSGDYLEVASSTGLSFGTDNFTLEMWLYLLTIQDTCLWDTIPIGGGSQRYGGFAFVMNSSGNLQIYSAANFRGTSTSSLSANTWHHIALTRTGSTWRFYIDGTQDATSFSHSVDCTDDTGLIGRVGDSAAYFLHGYIDDVRVTKGVSRPITLPTAAFPDA